jgi:general stress protein 26
MEQSLLANRARDIIEKVPYMAIASVDEAGMPWNAPVFTAYDQSYNFYWGTYINSQKSKNIRNNGHVFLVLYDSTAPAGEGEGVYIKARASELTDQKEIELAHTLLTTRHAAPYWKIEEVQGTAPIRLYKAVPEKVWLNGEGNEGGKYIDVRIAVNL